MPYKISIIGLDTSHGTAFPEIMQDPASAFSLPEMHATRCFAFETAFQNAEGIAKRSAYLQSIGVQMCPSLEEAVADCNAIFLEINDPSLHLEYFRKVAGLGVPVFLDKPFADSIASTRQILKIAEENNTVFFTSSSLRFAQEIQDAMTDCEFIPQNALVWGPLGTAPAGSSIVWYGVHAVEMLQRMLGPGATSVKAMDDQNGCLAIVNYQDGRRGIVELNRDRWNYGACLRNAEGKNKLVEVTSRIPFYYSLLQQILQFLKTGVPVVKHGDSFEVMAILEAIEESRRSGLCATVQPFTLPSSISAI